VLTLLRNPAVAAEMAAAGKEKVRREFLTTTNILQYLRLFRKLIRREPIEPACQRH
jgi:trehalose synthase